MRLPVSREGVEAHPFIVQFVGSRHAVKARHRAAAVAHHVERRRKVLPPERYRIDGLAGLVPGNHCHDFFAVGGNGGLDRKTGGFAGEKCLANHGILDQVDHVCRKSPQVGARCVQQLLAQHLPCGALIVAVALRIGCLQTVGDDPAHNVQQCQAVTTRLDEFEAIQLLEERVGRRLRAQRRQHRFGDASHDGYRIDAP